MQDISGFGKCSLTVAIPIISAMGIEVSVVPTAVLSTHTGGLGDYTYRDLTEDIVPFVEHWQSLGIKFDALYSGFLGSTEQINIISRSFDMLKNRDTIILVDPVMGDNGELYKGFTSDIIAEMRKLCSNADIIVPNITEALFMLGYEYREGPYEERFVKNALTELADGGAKKVVITGVSFNTDEIGVAVFDKEKNEFNYIFRKKIDAYYPGTGDIFCSVLLGSILNNMDLKEATQVAIDFTVESIVRTNVRKTDPRYGVNFEQGIPNLIKKIFS